MNKANLRRVLLLMCAVVVLLIVLRWPRGRAPSTSGFTSTVSAPSGSDSVSDTNRQRPRLFHSADSTPTAPATAEEIVAAKLKQFARSRRDVMYAMAKQKNVEIPDIVERYFDALETGDWIQIKVAFDAISGGEGNAGFGSERLPAVQALWAPIIDAYGVAE